MKIKKEFSICGKLWRTQYKWGLKFEGEMIDGLCDPNSRIISIRRELPKEEKIKVFLHELTHALLFETHLSPNGLDAAIEEILCDSIADCLNELFTLHWKRTS